MIDKFGRKIDYLRLSVIDKCNLRCSYCHDGNYDKMPASSIISYEEILVLVKVLQKRGLKHIKITGGEPLLRKNIDYFISELDSLGLDISLTTNGVFFDSMAQKLKSAGLRKITFGLDSLDPQTFSTITGSDLLPEVMKGINKAIELQFDPIKINVVLLKDINEDIKPWVDFVRNHDVVVRFVEVMPFVNGNEPISNVIIKEEIEKITKLEEINVEGNGPAIHYKSRELKGSFGFISPQSDSFCHDCSRIRLNAQGKIRACLFENETFDFLKLVRNGYTEEKLFLLLNNVLENKPENKKDLKPKENMCQIGG